MVMAGIKKGISDVGKMQWSQNFIIVCTITCSAWKHQKFRDYIWNSTDKEWKYDVRQNMHHFFWYKIYILWNGAWFVYINILYRRKQKIIMHSKIRLIRYVLECLQCNLSNFDEKPSQTKCTPRQTKCAPSMCVFKYVLLRMISELYANISVLKYKVK